jgi:hypothetical protein
VTQQTLPYVFISYSHDDSGFAAALSSRLHRAGIGHFRDTEVIQWGESIPEQIHAALDRATHLLILISPGSEQSQWVSYETGFARGRQVTLVPYLLHPRMSVPGFLANLRYIRTREDERKFINSLVVSTQRIQQAQKGTVKTKDGQTALQKALRKVKSQHPQVRRDAIEVLVQHKAINDLMEMLGHRDSRVRAAAAEGLAQLRHMPALPYLVDGLGLTAGNRGAHIIPGVEESLAHYKLEALEVLFERMPERLNWDTRPRWVRALANAVDSKSVLRLTTKASESHKCVFIEAALQSGLSIPKRDLMPAIKDCLRTDSWWSSETDVAKWISQSPVAATKWARSLVRQWLEDDVVKHDDNREKYFYPSGQLAKAALRMDAISVDELDALIKTIRNRELAKTLREIGTQYAH